jgi:hypothetical protein
MLLPSRLNVPFKGCAALIFNQSDPKRSDGNNHRTAAASPQAGLKYASLPAELF